MTQALHPVFLSLALYAGLHAAVSDLRSGRIPNALTVPLLCAAPLVHGFVSGPGALWASLLSALLCGAVPLFLFVRGGIGGGDVKLFAALGALLGYELALQAQLLSFFFAAFYGLARLAFRGELLATFISASRLLIPKRWHHDRVGLGPSESSALTIRLGAAILLATLYVLAPEALPWLL